MNAAAARNERQVYTPSSMKGPLVKSGILHVVIFVLAAVGIPFVAKKPPIITTPINIEIVDVDKLTQTNKPAPPKKAPEKLEKPEPPKSKPKPTPKMTEDKPPDLTKPEPPKLEEVAKAPPKVKPKPKPIVKPKKSQKDMATLLKNLIGEEEPTPKQPEDTEDNVSLSQIASLAERLTVSELDAFKQQLQPCWNIPIGAKYAEELIVEIRVLVNPDMTLQSASILNQSRYNRDSHFRAAADSAMRALRNPMCSPYKLPPDKYDQWKLMTIQFDPREMLQ